MHKDLSLEEAFKSVHDVVSNMSKTEFSYTDEEFIKYFEIHDLR